MAKTSITKRLLKYLFYGVLNLVVLIAAAIIAVPLLVDENDIKAQIAETVKARTGREIQLGGELKVSVFPWLGAELSDVRLANAQGFAGENFASLKHLQVRVELLPLTRRELRMDTVSVDGLDLRLQRKPDGSNNWEDLAKAGGSGGAAGGTAGAAGGEAAGSGKSEFLAVFALGGVDIKNARIEYRDAQQRVQLSNLSLHTGPVALNAPIDVQLDTHFDLSGAQKSNDLKGQVQARTRFGYELSAQRYRLEDLNADLTLSQQSLGDTPAKLHLSGGLGFDQGAGIISAKALQVKLDGSLAAGAVPARIQLAMDTDLELRLREQTLAMSRLNINIPEFKQAGRQLSLQAKTLLAGNLKTGQYLLNGFSASGQLTDPAIARQAIAYQLDADFALDLPASELKTSNLRLGADALKAGGTLKANWANPPATASGTLAIPEFALRKVLNRFGIALPKTRDPKAFGRAGLSGRFYADARQLKLEDLKASLDASKLTGNLNIKNFSKPAIHYRLAIDKLDADAYLAPRQKGAPPLAIAALPVNTLRALDIDGRLDVGRLQYSGLHLSKVQVGLKAGKGLVQLQPLQASLGKGRYQGHLRVDARQATPRISIDEQLKNVDLHQLLSSLGVQTGALNLRGGRSDLRLRGQFSADPSGQRLSARQVALDGRIAGRAFKGGPLKVALRGNLDLDLKAKTARVEGLDAAFAEFRTSGDLSASGLATQPQYEARLKVAPFNPRKLAARLGVRIPRTADKKVLRTVSLESHLKGTADSLQADPLILSIDGTTLKGTITVAGFKKPAIVFDLSADKLNLDRYLPPQRRHQAATPGAAATVLPLYLVRNLNLNGKLQVRKFRVSGLRMNNVRITAKARDGRLQLNPLGADLYQGSYQGNIQLDTSQKQPKLSVNETIQKVRIGKLLGDLNGKAPPLTGAANVHAVLTTVGTDTRVMKRNLNGEVSFSIQNGTLEKVDLVNSMCSALAAIDLGHLNKRTLATGLLGLIAATRSKPKTAASAGSGNTRFTDLHGSARVNNGVARNQDLLMTSPVVRVTGAGSLDIPANNINYLAKAELVQNCAGIGKRDLSGQLIPVQITGPVDNPKISPQLTAGLVNALRGKRSQTATTGQPANPTGAVQQQLNPTQPAQPSAPIKRSKELRNARDKILKGVLEGLFK